MPTVMERLIEAVETERSAGRNVREVLMPSFDYELMQTEQRASFESGALKVPSYAVTQMRGDFIVRAPVVATLTITRSDDVSVITCVCEDTA